MTDKAIAAELGKRFRTLRLRHNITQAELSERTLLSLNVIKALESGKAKLGSMIAVLRELDALEKLDEFLPEPGVSPLQLAKMKGRQRQRASGKRDSAAKKTEPSEW
jgi:transcriptional regulator with XRE-family HTH domain